MLELLCFQTAFEQHVNNRLVYSKLFCGRELENIKHRAELLFQYNPKQYEIFNMALLLQITTQKGSSEKRAAFID